MDIFYLTCPQCVVSSISKNLCRCVRHSVSCRMSAWVLLSMCMDNALMLSCNIESLTYSVLILMIHGSHWINFQNLNDSLGPFLFAMYLNVYTSNIFNYIQTIPFIFIYHVQAYHLYFDSKPIRT